MGSRAPSGASLCAAAAWGSVRATYEHMFAMDLRTRVGELLDAGLSGSEIARRLEVSHSTVSRIAARLGRRLAAARGSRFDWSAIRGYYEAGHTIADCCHEFGVSRGAFDRAVTRGDIVPRQRQAPAPSVTRRAVKELLESGLNQTGIAAELGLSKATIGITFEDWESRRTRASRAATTGTKFSARTTMASEPWNAASGSDSQGPLGARPWRQVALFRENGAFPWRSCLCRGDPLGAVI